MVDVLTLTALLIAIAAAASGANNGQGSNHGPCILEFGTPGDKSEKCWTLVFSDAEPGEPKNPSLAKYGNNWPAAAKAYPAIAAAAGQVKSGLADSGYQLSSKWSPKHPYARVCVPSPAGLSSCGLRRTDFVFHLNPGPLSDATAPLFYKGFVRNGQVVEAGKSAH